MEDDKDKSLTRMKIDGDICITSEPEFIGKIPVRTELTVLSADTPKDRTVGWTVTCYDGGEVYLKDAEGVNLTTATSIKKGDKVIVPSLIGYIEMTVTSRGKKKGRAESENTLAYLDFAKDERECWTSSMTVNKKLLK